MENQLNFPIYKYDEGNVSLNVAGSANQMLDNWENYIENNNIYVSDYDVHLLLVNTTGLGAGALRGGAAGPRGGGSIANSEGTAAFANSAVGYLDACYGGQSTYRATVVHEVGHAALHNGLNLPENNNEHSTGAVFNTSDDAVTPMQLWYTGDPCSGNSPPSANCNNRPPDEYAEGVTLSMSGCSQRQMERYMSNW